MGGHAKQHNRRGDERHNRHDRSIHGAKKTKVAKDIGVPKLSSIAQKLMNTAARHSHSVLSLQHRQPGIATVSFSSTLSLSSSSVLP